MGCLLEGKMAGGGPGGMRAPLPLSLFPLPEPEWEVTAPRTAQPHGRWTPAEGRFGGLQKG